MSKSQQYLCIKDWKVDSGIYFEKDKHYKGVPYNNGKSVKMYGEVGMVINFHQGSDYFNIK
ncbi:MULTISPECIES: hypothetical protein [Lysinibacillus]|uniref:hypothetical protein n=1 Tax=Lysinibacillus TaxID=400634 RepID=UPI00214CEAC1|nr:MULTISPECIES: hypothetical protein [Lysinibacillus]UUV25937.1 hypothetical protein NP781_04775 [Lysinibacillus sp. FN11]UYB48810.1 hypothetical protein OCI51_07565 [Lysinibacillus capsici]